MSVPARAADPSPALPRTAPSPRRSPRVDPRPARTPGRGAAARPHRTLPPHPRSRARRGSPVAFWVLVALVAATLIIGIASLSALLVESSFAVEDLRARVDALEREHGSLRERVAADSSPARVMAWASDRGMVMPEEVVIVRLPAPRGAAG